MLQKFCDIPFLIDRREKDGGDKDSEDDEEERETPYSSSYLTFVSYY